MSKFIQITDLNLKLDFDSIDDNEIKYYYFDKSLKPGTEIINTELVSEIIPITVKDCGEKYYKIYVDGVLKYINQQDFEKILGQGEESSKPQLNTIPRGCINKRWKWVVKEKSGALYLYEDGSRPKKIEEYGIWCAEETNYYPITSVFDEAMFKDVNWDDDEPTMIED